MTVLLSHKSVAFTAQRKIAWIQKLLGTHRDEDLGKDYFTTNNLDYTVRDLALNENCNKQTEKFDKVRLI